MSFIQSYENHFAGLNKKANMSLLLAYLFIYLFIRYTRNKVTGL
jgi:hypothetical protein